MFCQLLAQRWRRPNARELRNFTAAAAACHVTWSSLHLLNLSMLCCVKLRFCLVRVDRAMHGLRVGTSPSPHTLCNCVVCF